MTAEELIKLNDWSHRYELIKGELLTMSPAGDEHGEITINLSTLLNIHVKANRLGVCRSADTGFKLETNPDTVLAPDSAFIRRVRVGVLTQKYRAGAPDLVVEVLSPDDRKRKVEDKTARWLGLGASVVWLVDPKQRTVDVRLADGRQNLLTVQDELTGDDIIPGFRCRVAEIFD
jgi:Uma2 family endonuclease